MGKEIRYKVEASSVFPWVVVDTTRDDHNAEVCHVFESSYAIRIADFLNNDQLPWENKDD